MKISLFRGGVQNTTPDLTIESWDDFVDIVTSPKVGQKNGDYFIRGLCDGTRDDKNIKTIDFIIIDGDKTTDNGSSCVPLLAVHEVLKEKNITHVIYNSYSNDIYNNINKWRAVIPSDDIVDAETLRQGVAEIITIFHSASLPVCNVGENNVLSQPWFTPRVRAGYESDFDFRFFDGNKYSLTGNISESAAINESSDKIKEGTGIFSWDIVREIFISGSLHQGLKSAIGWMVFSTDWADSQIKQLMATMIMLCPDKEKRNRAIKKGEIDSLIKYCREKSGTNIVSEANWKDHLISADKLQHKDFPPIKWAVEGIIPEGLTIFAGDPKAGKSLAAVDICSAIASGTQALGKCDCVAGDVVYISLEDPERRVKERIKQQCDRWPSTFHLVTGGIPHVGEEFYKILDEIMLLWPDNRAIIIDTMQFIVPPKQRGVDDYSHYYKVLDPLHRWSIENHVAVVLITHKTKAATQNGDNLFSGIIGSVAIQGTADALIILQRNHLKKQDKDTEYAEGFLHVTGRDLENSSFSLEFDDDGVRWSMIGEMTGREITGNPNWMIIFELLKTKGKMGPSEISNEANINLSTVKSILRRMVAAVAVKNEDGKYFLINRTGL